MGNYDGRYLSYGMMTAHKPFSPFALASQGKPYRGFNPNIGYNPPMQLEWPRSIQPTPNIPQSEMLNAYRYPSVPEPSFTGLDMPQVAQPSGTLPTVSVTTPSSYPEGGIYATQGPEVPSGANTFPTKYELPGWARTGGAVLGGAMAVGGLLGALSNKGGNYDSMISELDNEAKRLSDPNSDWYTSAWSRYRQAFTDASPTLDTLTGATRAAGMGAQSASYLGRAQVAEAARRNRAYATDATKDLYLQGRQYADVLRQQRNQLELDKQASDASFWEQGIGAGMSLLKLVL